MLGVCLPLLSGCIVEDLGGGVTFVNSTEQELIIIRIATVSPGERWNFEINGCGDGDFEIRTPDDQVYARLTEEWCKGQVWIIEGPDQIVLEEAE